MKVRDSVVKMVSHQCGFRCLTGEYYKSFCFGRENLRGFECESEHERCNEWVRLPGDGGDYL